LLTRETLEKETFFSFMISPQSPMRDVLEVFPGAQRALFQSTSPQPSPQRGEGETSADAAVAGSESGLLEQIPKVRVMP